MDALTPVELVEVAAWHESSAGASLNEVPHELQQLALNFLATFFSRHLTDK